MTTVQEFLLAVLPRARPRWRNISGWEPDKVRVGELVVLEGAVLDVLADPVAEVALLLELLVALGSHRGLKERTERVLV